MFQLGVSQYTLHVNLMPMKSELACSGTNHRTDDYTDNFVIRRGGDFNLTIKTKDFDPEKSKFHFELKTGDRPRKKNGTWIQIYEDAEQDRDDYFFEIRSKSEFEVNCLLLSNHRNFQSSKTECSDEKDG